MNASNGSNRERFTVWGSGLIIVAAVLMLLDRGGASFTVDQNYVFFFWGTIARIATALLLCAGFVVTAVGRRDGQHLTGPGILAAVLLSIFGAAPILDTIVLAVVRTAIGLEASLLAIVQLVVMIAGLVAARAAYRSGVADKSTRVLLVVVAAVQAVFTILALIPAAGTHAVANSLYVLFPLSLIAFGVALMFDGRHARVRNRLGLMREHW